MFTGIIEALGEVKRVSTRAGLWQIELKANKVLDDLKVRDSIAVNGVCLTVTACQGSSFSVQVIKETLKKTNLGRIKSGEKVNLERAVKLNDRLGGHLVSGHIDGLARIIKKEKLNKETYLWLRVDLELLKQIVRHGSVALEGVSLTAAEIKSNLFKTALIPYTLRETTLGGKKTGDELNLELDYLGKQVRQYLNGLKR